jgi:hypothetical protein
MTAEGAHQQQFNISSTQEGKKWGKLNSEERLNFSYSVGDLMG